MSKEYIVKGFVPISSDHVWAFDLGKGSIGEAVRIGNEFKHKASLLIPADFAETRTARDRRRMFRTRQAHHAREQWLREVFQSAGLPVLYGRNYDSKSGRWKPGELGDPRLERQFPAIGDDTCYTSCLLRIKLLRGEKLEPWQVFKAFHSAIQRRGYDPDIPWKTRETRRVKEKEGKDDDAKTAERMRKFELELHVLVPDKPDFHFPAYFDAWKMGLWNPAEPNELKMRCDCQGDTTRNQIVPRKLVEAEIRRMMMGAAKHYPSLAEKSDYLLYGPAQKPYASINPKLRKEFDLLEGGTNDWQGVVGQKIPRFDNRIIAKCALIPRLNVCKLREGDKGQPHAHSLTAVEVAFLMKLKNLRFQEGGQVKALSASEIGDILADPRRKIWALTETAWRKYCAGRGRITLPGHQQVDTPRFSGRSRFCRPALEILKRLILSGQKPSEFLQAEMERLNGNNDPFKGLVPNDLNFLREMAARNDTWEGLYIPNQQLEALAQSTTAPDEAISRLIGQQNDPVVRHRLEVFVKRLKALGVHGIPNQVVLEFVREDFMGKKAKMELSKFMRDRAEDRKKAREEAAKVGATEKSAGLKLELLRAQGGRCLYTDVGLEPSRLDEYEIEHIIPRARGGPDAVFNYVLTTNAANAEKDNRTPYEWLAATEGWDAYVNRVRSRSLVLRNKKVQLLISPDAEQLAERYTALAETAWIAKLAQTIVGLHFGWRNGVDEQGNKRVTVISGGLTGRIRRKYGLNRILNPGATDEEEAEKKNRNDDRHHALDAMVISFIPGWVRDAKKEGFFRFPEGVQREFFAQEIKSVMPQNLCYEKPALAETIYGARGNAEERVIVQRVELFQLAMKGIAPGKTKFDLAYLREQIKAVRDEGIKKKLVEVHDTSPDEAQWKAFCESFTLARKDGSPGSSVKRVLMNVGDPAEYRDLSKDGTGAYRKALKGHRGQIVYVETVVDKKGKTKETVQVRPIYAFESPTKVRRQLIETLGDKCRIVEFFQSGCLIEVIKEVPHSKMSLPAGRYLLNTIRTSKDVKVTTADGKTHPDIPRYNLAEMVSAGLKRVDFL